jgi:subtilisin family serine protease
VFGSEAKARVIRLSLLLGLLGLLILLPAGSAAAPLADRYIVVLERGEPGAVAQNHVNRFGADTSYVYRTALRGYAARIPAARLSALRADPRVAYVEPDRIVHATQLVLPPLPSLPPLFGPPPPPPPPPPQTLPWGIDRIDADLSSALAGDGSGEISNVNAYVIDTGIDTAHADLRVVAHLNFSGLFGGGNRDCNGHGTHVAGTLAARDNTISVVGAAPGTALTAVKVLTCAGTGLTSSVIRGVDWVTANAVKPAVANLSLGGAPSTALDDAVRRSAAAGIVYSVAAGNEGADACQSSPARAGAGTENGIVTTAAIGQTDGEASFSNFGPCVDIWAPGVGIPSTWTGGGTNTLSGTSMAAPHVGGTAALHLSSQTGASPATVEAQLKAVAPSTGTVSKDGRAIKLVYAGSF